MVGSDVAAMLTVVGSDVAALLLLGLGEGMDTRSWG